MPQNSYTRLHSLLVWDQGRTLGDETLGVNDWRNLIERVLGKFVPVSDMTFDQAKAVLSERGFRSVAFVSAEAHLSRAHLILAYWMGRSTGNGSHTTDYWTATVKATLGAEKTLNAMTEAEVRKVIQTAGIYPETERTLH